MGKLVYKGNASQPDPVKQVTTYYSHKAVIQDNLDSEFKLAKLHGSDGYKPQMRTGIHTVNLPDNLEAQMKRRASVGSTSVFQPFHSPFRTRNTVEQPTKRKDRNEWYRYYYKYNPVVHTAINTHSTFPLSRFRVEHDDIDFSNFCNELVDDINLHDFMISMAREFYIIGECIPFGLLDDVKDPSRWKKFILLDPDKVNLNTHTFAWAGGHPYVIELEPDKDLIKIVEKGPSDEKTGELYQSIPPDIIDAVKKKQNIPIPQLQVSHFKREINPFVARGESILSCCLNDLMYYDKLIDGQVAIIDRHIMPKEIWKIGEPDNPADSAEIQNFQELLAAQYHAPNQAYVTHHAIQFQMEGAGGRVLPLQPEFENINKRLFAGLGINESMITSSGPSFASSSVAMDIMVGRYEQFRTQMEQWLIHSVFKPLCKIHKIYKKQNSKTSKYKRFTDVKVPDLPRIVWDKAQLRDEMMKIQLFQKLVADGIIPRKELYKLLNLSSAQMRQEFLEQFKEDLEDKAKIGKLSQAMGAQSPGGLPNMGGPGGGIGGAGAGAGMPGGMGGMGGPPGGMPGSLPGMGLGPEGGPLRQPGPGGGGGMGGGGGSTSSAFGGGTMQRPPDSNRATQLG